MLRVATAFSLLIGILATAAVAQDAPRAERLRCESVVRPLNVDVRRPRLSWRSTSTAQAAYQIQVASTREKLGNGIPDIWDSGRVVSDRSLNVLYAGTPLTSRQICYWRVRVWEEGQPKPGPWSESASWEMGLLDAGDWKAHWIRGPEFPPVAASDELTHWMQLAGTTLVRKDGEPLVQTKGIDRLAKLTPATLFRRDFTIDRPLLRARLHTAAAGYAEVYLDGRKLGRRILNPAQTDYESRILYDTDAVEQLLPVGRHTLAIHLGEGWYGQNVAFTPTRFYYGRPAVLVQLELTFDDGSTDTILSDSNWLCHPSPVVKNSIYAGEVYDARRRLRGWCTPSLKTRSPGWQPAVTLNRPLTGRLQAQRIPPITFVRDVSPKRILQPERGVWVFDFGQNFAGLVTLHLQGENAKAGTAVYLRYAEWANDVGKINQESGGGFATAVNQVDCYVAGGADREQWTPSFTWHGFRYVEVTGLREAPDLNLLTGHLVRSDVQPAGRFICSDPHLNRVHETALWTYESNLMSIPSDCPIRERCGWTGDAHATVTMSNFNFTMGLFWEKYLHDFRTSRFVSPSIVPGRRSGQTSPDWAVAQVLIAWEHYLFHDDLQLLREHYDGLAAFMEHASSLRDGQGIIQQGYGDWCDPVRTPGTPRIGGAGRPQQTPPPLTTTALFIHACDIMEQIAAALGDLADAKQYRAWQNETADAFHRRFFDSVSNTYGSQTADAMAICFGIVPPQLRDRVAASLNRDVLVNWHGHASVGALGHRWLYPALSDAGYADTAMGAFCADGYPGFHYLFDTLKGTTLWERKGAFDPATMEAPVRSLCHPFQGGYDAWFFLVLGGIRPDPQRPGFKHFYLRPAFPDRLEWVKVDFESGYGPIRSHWRSVEERIEWQVHVPSNTTATAELPADLKTSHVDGPAAEVLAPKATDGGQLLQLGPGDYQMGLALKDG